MRLAEILHPWIEKLNIPGGLTAWHGSGLTLRGHSHYYSPIRNISAWSSHPTPRVEDDWVMTVKGDHVEIRNSSEEEMPPTGYTEVPPPKVIPMHILSAADPDFLEKLERDLRAVVDYLSRN